MMKCKKYSYPFSADQCYYTVHTIKLKKKEPKTDGLETSHKVWGIISHVSATFQLFHFTDESTRRIRLILWTSGLFIGPKLYK